MHLISTSMDCKQRSSTVSQKTPTVGAKTSPQQTSCLNLVLFLDREEHSMDQCQSRLKLSENLERHWSIPISGEIHMDQSLVHTFPWGNSHGPMVLKVLQTFLPTLVLVHAWLFPVGGKNGFGAILPKNCTSW